MYIGSLKPETSTGTEVGAEQLVYSWEKQKQQADLKHA